MTGWTDQQPEPGYRDHPGFAAWQQSLATQPNPATAQGRRIREMQLALDRRNEALLAADARNHLLEEQIETLIDQLSTLTDERDAARAFATTIQYVPVATSRRQQSQHARDTALLVVLVLGGAALVVCGLLVLGAGFAALRAWGQ